MPMEDEEGDIYRRGESKSKSIGIRISVEYYVNKRAYVYEQYSGARCSSVAVFDWTTLMRRNRGNKGIFAGN